MLRIIKTIAIILLSFVVLTKVNSRAPNEFTSNINDSFDLYDTYSKVNYANKNDFQKSTNNLKFYNLNIELTEVRHIYGYVGDYVNHWYQIDDIRYSLKEKAKIMVTSTSKVNLISTSCDCNEKLVDKDDEVTVINIENLNKGINHLKVVIRLHENYGKYAGHSAEYHFYYNLSLEDYGKSTIQKFDTFRKMQSSKETNFKEIVRDYYDAIRNENFDRAIEFYSDNVNRYYYKTNTTKSWIYDTMNSYKSKAKIEKAYFSIDFESLETKQLTNGNMFMSFNMLYEVDRKETNKASHFKLKIYVELNSSNKIVSIHEQIIEKK